MDIGAIAPADREGNVARLHDLTAEHHGDQLAVAMGDRTLSHTELAERSARFAGGLHALGLSPDDRLLVYLPNCPEYVVTAFGAFKAGTPLSPMNPQYKPREIVGQLRSSGARAVITHPSLRERLAEALDDVEMDPTVITVNPENETHDVPFDTVSDDPIMVERQASDVALQPYTSGTTGTPKGVLLTHRNMWAKGYSVLKGVLGMKSPPEDIRSLVWLPMYHITGFTHCAFQPLVYGGGLILRDAATWDPDEAMRVIEAENITNFIGVLAMYSDMVNSESFGEYDLTSLESVIEGGAKMSVAVQREFESVTGVEVAEGYGLTETNGATHLGLDSTFGLKVGTIGQPLRMTDAKVVDDNGEEVPVGETGEILVRGPQVAAGYHELPDETEAAFREDGYFRTGDIGRRDPDNYYEIVDRKKHMINTAGYNVYPSEVEELLYEHDAIAEAAVVGLSDDRRNEVPAAIVVLASSYEPGVDITAEELKHYCLDNLAEYKHPREIRFVEQLPRTASGKVQKFKLIPDDRDD